MGLATWTPHGHDGIEISGPTTPASHVHADSDVASLPAVITALATVETSAGAQAKVDLHAATPHGGSPPTPVNIPLICAAIWTNMPAALAEFLVTNSYRTKADLTNATQCRVIANLTAVGGSATAEIRIQYSLDGTTFLDLGTFANTPAAVIGTTTGLKVGSWATIAAGAKADVFLRVMGINGNGAADPNFQKIVLQVK